MYEKLSAAAQYIQGRCDFVPRVGIVLGSGLGAFIERVEKPTVIAYGDIPFFRDTTVEGHRGRLILGHLRASGSEPVAVAVLQGRLHVYEGCEMDEIVFGVRTLATLGAETLLLTNAAGGINPDFSPGELVLINDHINLSGRNPLVGPNISELGPRFPDMTHAYHPQLRQCFHRVARQVGVTLKEGVYCSVLGPTYETPAEIRMLAALGGDMVGMSTVPEAIAASHLGLRVAGISCITNMAAGLTGQRLSHDDIKDEALRVMDQFSNLLVKAIVEIAQQGLAGTGHGDGAES